MSSSNSTSCAPSGAQSQAPHRGVSDCAASLRNAAVRFQRNPLRFWSDVLLYTNALCTVLRVPMPRSRVTRADSLASCALDVVMCAFDVAESPTPQSLRTLVRAVAHYAHALDRANDSTPVRAISLTAPVPDAPSPLVRYAAPGALEWQTTPVISENPSLAASYMQASARDEVRDTRRAQQSADRLTRALSHAAPTTVVTTSRTLPRMGRPVLSLNNKRY